MSPKAIRLAKSVSQELGRICKAQPDHDGRDKPHGMVVGRPFFVPCGEAAKRLIPVDQPRNLLPLAVAGPVEEPCSLFMGRAWQGAPDTMAPCILPNQVTAI